MCRSWLALLSVLAVSMPLGHVEAHGRFPNPNGLVFHPIDADAWVVRSTRGLMMTSDGGATWHWVCLEVAEASTFGQEDPVFSMMADGSLVASSGLQGVVRSDPSWCRWSETVLSEDQRYFVIDQARHPTLPDSTFVVTSSGAPTVNGVYRSDDGGRTWAPTAEDGIDSVLFESIAIAPSDPEVMYLTALVIEPSGREGWVYASRDGGASWPEPPTPIEIHAGETRAVLAGVDPTDPDRMFVRIAHDDFLVDPPPERLLLSEDGGASFTLVHTAPHLRSFAIAADGATVWVGDDEAGGLWRSQDGGHHFELVQASLQVHCLEWHLNQLWMCANDFREGFAVATSEDLGASFTPVFTFDDVQGMLPCPGDALFEICDPFIVCDALPELGLDPDELVPEAGCSGSHDGDAGAASDAAASESEASGGGSCGCRVPSTGTPGAASMAGLWLLLALWRSARRRS